MASPKAYVVIDDGRRSLSAQTLDVIAIVLPPTLEPAGSSLLYSKDFYAVTK